MPSSVCSPSAFDEGGAARVHVRAAAGHAQRRQRRPAHLHRHAASPSQTKAPAPAVRVQLVQRRRVDHAQHRLPVFHQGDVDGELAIFLDELAGAVERIHQPVAPPLLALRPGHGRRFLSTAPGCRAPAPAARPRSGGARPCRPRSAASGRPCARRRSPARTRAMIAAPAARASAAAARRRPASAPAHARPASTSRTMNSAGERAAFRAILAQHQLVQGIQAPRHHFQLLRLVAGQSAFGYRSSASTRWISWVM